MRNDKDLFESDLLVRREELDAKAFAELQNSADAFVSTTSLESLQNALDAQELDDTLVGLSATQYDKPGNLDPAALAQALDQDLVSLEGAVATSPETLQFLSELQSEEAQAALRSLLVQGSLELSHLTPELVQVLVKNGLIDVQGTVRLTEAGAAKAQAVLERRAELERLSQEGVEQLTSEELIEGIAKGQLRNEGESLSETEIEPALEGLFDKVGTWLKDRKTRAEHDLAKSIDTRDITRERIKRLSELFKQAGELKSGAADVQIKTDAVMALFRHPRNFAKSFKEVLSNLKDMNDIFERETKGPIAAAIKEAASFVEIATKAFNETEDREVSTKGVNDVDNAIKENLTKFDKFFSKEEEFEYNRRPHDFPASERMVCNRVAVYVDVPRDRNIYFIGLSMSVPSLNQAKKHQFKPATLEEIQQFIKEMERFERLVGTAVEVSIAMNELWPDINKLITYFNTRQKKIRDEWFLRDCRKMVVMIIDHAYSFKNLLSGLDTSSVLASTIGSQLAFQSLNRYEKKA